MKTKDVVIVILAAVVFVLAVTIAYNFLTVHELKSGHTDMEGFLELEAYPRISEAVPTVMVYVLIPMYDQYEIYLTENGIPISALEGFSENDLVRIEGVLYSLDAVDQSETYWMIEIFNISEGD